MFLYKNLFFSISSVISIPIMLIGINGGYFPAICRVCLFNGSVLRLEMNSSCFRNSSGYVFKSVILPSHDVKSNSSRKLVFRPICDFFAPIKKDLSGLAAPELICPARLSRAIFLTLVGLCFNFRRFSISVVSC